MPTTFGIEITGEPSRRGPPAEPRSPRPHPTRPLLFPRRARPPAPRKERRRAERPRRALLQRKREPQPRSRRAWLGDPRSTRRSRTEESARRPAGRSDRAKRPWPGSFPASPRPASRWKTAGRRDRQPAGRTRKPDDRRRAERARLAQSGIAKRGDDRAPGAGRRRNRREHGPRGELDFGRRLDRRESGIGVHGDHFESIAGDATSLFAQPSGHARIRVRIDDPQYSLGHLLPFTHFNAGDPGGAIG